MGVLVASILGASLPSDLIWEPPVSCVLPMWNLSGFKVNPFSLQVRRMLFQHWIWYFQGFPPPGTSSMIPGCRFGKNLVEWSKFDFPIHALRWRGVKVKLCNLLIQGLLRLLHLLIQLKFYLLAQTLIMFIFSLGQTDFVTDVARKQIWKRWKLAFSGGSGSSKISASRHHLLLVTKIVQ